MTRFEYGRAGILLHVTAPAGVAEVWRQRRELSPFEPHHFQEAFSVSRGAEANTWLVLVDYPFDAGCEWLLGLKSGDGYWASESPYFPDAPSLGDPEWAALKSQAIPILPQ